MTKPSEQLRLPAAAERLLSQWHRQVLPYDEPASRAADRALERIARGDKGTEAPGELTEAPLPEEPGESAAAVRPSLASPLVTSAAPDGPFPSAAATPATGRPPSAAGQRQQYLVGASVALAGLAVAAGVWLFVARPGQQEPAKARMVPSAPAAVVAKSQAPSPAQPSALPRPAPSPAAKESVVVVDPEQLALEGVARRSRQVATASGQAASRPTPVAAASPPAASPQAPPPKEVPSWLKATVAVEEEPTERADAAPTPPAEPEAEGPTTGMQPADQSAASEDLPTQPSGGAVQAALGKVTPAARQCVAGGEPVTALVTFRGSTGKVLSVAVAGSADPAAASCVRAALRAAEVSPFAKATYSASTTISP